MESPVGGEPRGTWLVKRKGPTRGEDRLILQFWNASSKPGKKPGVQIFYDSVAMRRYAISKAEGGIVWTDGPPCWEKPDNQTRVIMGTINNNGLKANENLLQVLKYLPLGTSGPALGMSPEQLRKLRA